MVLNTRRAPLREVHEQVRLDPLAGPEAGNLVVASQEASARQRDGSCPRPRRSPRIHDPDDTDPDTPKPEQQRLLLPPLTAATASAAAPAASAGGGGGLLSKVKLHLVLHTYMHTYIHTYTHIRTYITTYIRTYAHTY